MMRAITITNPAWRFFAPILVLVAAVIAAPAQAARVSDIYRAIVPVENQGDTSRNAGIVSGLSQVLVKVSGDRRVLQKSAVQTELARAQSYVTEIGYSRVDFGEEEPQLALNVSYSEQKINHFLRREAIQIWPATRPDLLVWLVADTLEGGKQYVSPQEFPALDKLLAYHMSRRGAPLVKPALDLQDRRTLSASDAWQFNRAQLKAAAQRYGVQQWLVIRFYQTSKGEWRGSSWLNNRGETDLQHLKARSLDALISQAVDRAVDKLSANYVFIPQANADALMLTLENIRSYKAFQAAVDYLQALELVRDVQVVAVDADQLSLALEMDGDEQILLAALRRDRRLREIKAGSTGGVGGDPVMYEHRFRWER